jgi:antitoxin MazE6
MKTAISIGDWLFREADEAARLLGLSRSRLFPQAMGDFLQRQRLDQMLTQLNKVYAEEAQPDERPVLRGMKARVRRTVKDRWRPEFARARSTGSTSAAPPAPRPPNGILVSSPGTTCSTEARAVPSMRVITSNRNGARPICGT